MFELRPRLREHDGHEEVEEEVRHDEHVQDEEEPRLRFKPAADGSRREAELVRVRLSREGRGNALNRAYECGRPYQGTSGPRATTCDLCVCPFTHRGGIGLRLRARGLVLEQLRCSLTAKIPPRAPRLGVVRV